MLKLTLETNGNAKKLTLDIDLDGVSRKLEKVIGAENPTGAPEASGKERRGGKKLSTCSKCGAKMHWAKMEKQKNGEYLCANCQK